MEALLAVPFVVVLSATHSLKAINLSPCVSKLLSNELISNRAVFIKWISGILIRDWGSYGSGRTHPASLRLAGLILCRVLLLDPLLIEFCGLIDSNYLLNLKI